MLVVRDWNVFMLLGNFGTSGKGQKGKLKSKVKSPAAILQAGVSKPIEIPEKARLTKKSIVELLSIVEQIGRAVGLSEFDSCHLCHSCQYV